MKLEKSTNRMPKKTNIDFRLSIVLMLAPEILVGFSSAVCFLSLGQSFRDIQTFLVKTRNMIHL